MNTQSPRPSAPTKKTAAHTWLIEKMCYICALHKCSLTCCCIKLNLFAASAGLKLLGFYLNFKVFIDF